MKEIIRYGLILSFICSLSSGVLAVVNGVTEPKIKLQKEKVETIALEEVMPQSINFRPKRDGEKIIYYLAYNRAQKINGFVIKAEGKGYSSLIEVVAGLNLNLEISEIKVLSQNETPGLGAQISEALFLGQFSGKNLDSLSQVQAITGATISSSSVIDAIRSKISELRNQLAKEVADAR